jgi:hypothetical protein
MEYLGTCAHCKITARMLIQDIKTVSKEYTQCPKCKQQLTMTEITRPYSRRREEEE